MPGDHGPWGGNDSRPPVSKLRLALWIGLVAGVVLPLWNLNQLFPGAIHSNYDEAWIIRLVAVLAFVSSGMVFARQINLGEVARNLAIWTGLAAILAVGYTFRDSFQDTASRVQSDFAPGYPVTAAPHELILTANADGSFYVFGKVNGVRVRFMVDTGASDIVLSPADARRAGIDFSKLKFDKLYGTANGIGRGAQATLSHLAVGPITESDVRVSVNQAEMGSSLLGMAFLKSLKSFEFSRDRLVLHW